MKINKPKTSKPAEKKAPKLSPEERVDSCESRLAQMEGDIANAEHRITAALTKTDEMAEEVIDRKVRSVLHQGSLYLSAIEQRVVQRFFDFLNEAPVWETCLVGATSVGSGIDHKEISKLYTQGWRYLGSSRDTKTGAFKGMILHRPKIPTTFEEFKKLYRDYQNGSIPKVKFDPKPISPKKGK